ncbi:MAG: dUTP diphosphatase [Actinomycetota bacterium]|nr:dUTP diphosphatase [Actinomycetota bacterium]
MKILFTKINPQAKVPEYAHEGDAGCDLASSIEVDISPGERAVIPTGIAVAIPEGYAGFVQPRSGLAAKHGIGIVNSPGLIDSHYRGEIKVILVNLDKKEIFHVKRGDKICQLVIQPVERANFVEIEKLEPTERGEGGFGSTGT